MIALLAVVIAASVQDPFAERRLAVLEGSDVALSRMDFRLRAGRVAYAQPRGGQVFACVNGTCGPPFDEIYFVLLKSDESTPAYRARLGKDWFVVDGDQKSEAADELGDLSLPLPCSPDGRLGFAFRKGPKWFVRVGDRTLGPFDGVRDPLFSPDGKDFAFPAQEGRRFRLVTAAAPPSPPVDGITEIRWSPDGKEAAYLAFAIGKGMQAITKAGPGPFHPRVHDLRWSPDGKRLAYVAGSETSEFLVIAGTPGPAFRSVSAAVFSPDGARLAYPAAEGRWGMMIDGERKIFKGTEGGFEALGAPVFSPDSRRVAYSASFYGNYAVLDGSLGERYGGAAWLEFSPDSGALTFVTPQPSPSGKTQQHRMHFGAVAGPLVDWVFVPRNFSADGKTVIYATLEGKEIWRRVLRR